MATVSHSTLFDFVSSSANNGKIITTASATGIAVGENIEIFYKVTGPNNVVLRDFQGTADVTLTQASPSIQIPTLVDVPLTTNSEYQEGTYVVEFNIASSTTGPSTLRSEFVLDVKKQDDTNCKITPNITTEVDCVCNKMLVTDSTDYKDTTFISREMTIVPPTIPNFPPPTNIVTSDQSVLISFSYTDVTYNINLASLYEHYYTSAGSSTDAVNAVFTVREDLIGTLAKEIKCDIDLCKLMNCVDQKCNELMAMADKRGGVVNLPKDILDDYLLIIKYLGMFNSFYNCGDYKKAQEYYEKLNELLGCDCGCDTGNANQPRPVTAPCGIVGSAVNAVIGSAPVIHNNVLGTVTISLDPTFIALVNSAVQNVVGSNTNGDGFISASVAAGVATVVFNSTPLKWSNWSVFNNTQRSIPEVDFDNTPLPLRWKINTFHSQITFDGTFSFTPPSPSPSTAICLLATPLLAVNSARSLIPIPCLDDNGECVGMLSLIGIGANRNVLFTPNTNYVIGTTITVNGIINYN